MRFIAGALIAMAILSGPTQAQAAPCVAVGGERPILSLDNRDEDFIRGLRIGLMFGLTPATFPQEEIAANPNACSRGEFEANADLYRVFGEDFDVPQRWAIGPNDRIVYLALMPPPENTLEWERRGGRGSINFTGDPLYVLAVANGDIRDVFAIFEGMPGDAQLVTAFKDALEGRLPRIATFDPRTGETQFTERHAL